MEILKSITKFLFSQESSPFEKLDKYWIGLHHIASKKLGGIAQYDASKQLFYSEIKTRDTYQRKEISKECVVSFYDRKALLESKTNKYAYLPHNK